VVGHESLHLNDVAAQTRETLANIRALFEAMPPAQRLPSSDSAAMLKIYVRDAGNADLVRAMVRAELGERVPLLVLQGDICRRELLLEIEGVYGG
jgi:chorismate lyase/3-hydroxybenzoate synthase